MAAFRNNPLSLSVSVEHVNDWARTAGASPMANAASAPAAQPARRPRTGRTLAELTVDDLLKKRRPWREFMGGMQPLQAFSLPATLEEASFKLTENVFEFIGNYLILALVCVCCVLYKRPVALLGILVVSAAWEWQQRQHRPAGGPAGPATPGGANPSPSGSRRGGRRSGGSPTAGEAPGASPAGGRGGTPVGRAGGAAGGTGAPNSGGPGRVQQLKQLLVTICNLTPVRRDALEPVTWAVLMFSQVVPALALGALATLAAVCLHGVMRNPVPAVRNRLFTAAAS